MASYIGQLRSAVIRIARGIVRGALKLWRDFAGPFWGPYPLLPAGERPGIVERGENLGQVNLQMQTSGQSAYDVMQKVSGTIGTFTQPVSPSTSARYSVQVEIAPPDRDPFFPTIRVFAPLGAGPDELAAAAEALLADLKAKYPGARIAIVGDFQLEY